MSDIFQPPKDLEDSAHCSSMVDYRKKYAESIDDPYAFWSPILEVRPIFQSKNGQEVIDVFYNVVNQPER